MSGASARLLLLIQQNRQSLAVAAVVIGEPPLDTVNDILAMRITHQVERVSGVRNFCIADRRTGLAEAPRERRVRGDGHQIISIATDHQVRRCIAVHPL